MRGKRGFTLIEVMVATAVIAFGSVMIFQALFTSLNAFDYYRRSLTAGLWMQEKIWQAQEQVRLLGGEAHLETDGEAVQDRFHFQWRLVPALLDETAGLYSISLDVSWKQGNRAVHLLRTAYALQEQEKE